MTITVYGIKSCSTMKKAFNKLNDIKVEFCFHDYKKLGIDKEKILTWIEELGIHKVINKKGTTWRKLSDEEKLKADNDMNYAVELLVENTSMIKRPIVEKILSANEVILLCGFNDDEFDKLK